MGSPKQESTPKRRREAADMEAMVGRVIRAMVRRAGDGDMDSLVTLEHIRLTLDPAMRAAVTALRVEPWSYSWTDIGNALGITKQAAQQRFGS